MNIECYFDGACEPKNPGGHIGWGFLVVDVESGEVLSEQSGYLPPEKKNTNNIAEYTALLELFKFLWRNNYAKDKIHVKGDSLMVINQMKGTYRIKTGAYVPFAHRCINAKKNFANLEFSHVRREYNTLADELSIKQLIERGVCRTVRSKKNKE